MANGKEKNEQTKPGYYSVIPAEVRYCKALGKPTARDLYGEIAALCNKHGYCFATNQYLADLYSIETRTVRRYLALLEKNGFVYIKLGKQRRIYLSIVQKRTGKEPELSEEPEDFVEASSHGRINGIPEKPEGEKTTGKAGKREKKYADDDLRLAELLLSKILLNFPTFENKKVKIEDWADEIRKLREIDKATGGQIEFMITWVQGGQIQQSGRQPRTLEPHDFWAKNILSATKLRKQWFTLVPQLQSALKKEVTKRGAADLRSPGKAPVGARSGAAQL